MPTTGTPMLTALPGGHSDGMCGPWLDKKCGCQLLEFLPHWKVQWPTSCRQAELSPSVRSHSAACFTLNTMWCVWYGYEFGIDVHDNKIQFMPYASHKRQSFSFCGDEFVNYFRGNNCCLLYHCLISSLSLFIGTLYWDYFIWCVSCAVVILTGFVICVCVCVCVCVCGFCNVWVCVCVGFVMCGCVYVWVL